MDQEQQDYEESETESESMDTIEEEEGVVKSSSESAQVYVPGTKLQEGEELVHDSSTYCMYHVAQTGAPCLSFDILRDSLGEGRTDYPMTAYLVAGTQSERTKQNYIILVKMSQLRKTEGMKDDDSEGEDEDEDVLEDDEPDMDTVMIQHSGAINRIRAAPQMEHHHMVATWSEKGVVSVWDTRRHVLLLDAPKTGGGGGGTKLTGHKESPLYCFSGHKQEGYALDWSQTVPGRLATGDCSKNIHVWNLEEEGGSTTNKRTKWLVDKRPFTGHSKSVEDLQWSPNEPSVFASCSVDETIRIWDCRASPDKANMLTCHAHHSDVNVIAWNKKDPFILSGGDDGVIKVWDLRQFKKDVPVASFKHHSAPITSLEWHPTDSTVFASSGEDDQVVQWDLSVEADAVDSQATPSEIPPQVLFIHQGQREVKELHWHPQIPGVMLTTALTGFNIFKTISV